MLEGGGVRRTYSPRRDLDGAVLLLVARTEAEEQIVGIIHVALRSAFAEGASILLVTGSA